MVRTKLLLLSSLALGVLAPGCVIYDEDADLRVYWQFAGRAGCGDANVTDVIVQVETNEEFFESDFYPCEAGYLDLPEFEKGDAIVTVLGFPPANPSFPNAGPTWVADRVVDLHGGFNEYTFVLVEAF